MDFCKYSRPARVCYSLTILTSFSSPALPAINMKGKTMRSKLDHTTLYHNDDTASSPEQGNSSLLQYMRMGSPSGTDCAGFSSKEVQRCGDVSTPACHDFPPSFPQQNQPQETEDDRVVPPAGDRYEVSLHCPTILSCKLIPRPDVYLRNEWGIITRKFSHERCC